MSGEEKREVQLTSIARGVCSKKALTIPSRLLFQLFCICLDLAQIIRIGIFVGVGLPLYPYTWRMATSVQLGVGGKLLFIP